LTDQPLRVAAYCRCSTDKQDDSIETQETLIRDVCAERGYILDAVFKDEAISASIPVEMRPGGSRLMSLVGHHDRTFNSIIVLRLDRLFRNPEDELGGLGYLGKHRCGLISIKDPIDRSTPTGELLHGIMMHVRSFERRQAGQRVKEHNKARAMTGKLPSGHPPLGYDYDPATQTVSVNERAGDVIRVFESFLECGGNACKAARLLNREGVKSARGNPIQNGYIRRAIANPFYRRRLTYDGRTYDARGLIPPLIPHDLLLRVDSLMQIIGPLKTRQRVGLYAYSSLMYCSECGLRMRHTTSTKDTSGGWVCASSRNGGLCISRRVADSYVEALVTQAMGVLARFKEEVADMKPVDHTPPDNDRLITRLADRRKRVVKAYIDGTITESERNKYLLEIEGEKLKLEDKPAPPPPLTPSIIREIVEAIPSDWRLLTNDQKRALLLALSAKLTLCTRRHVPLWLILETSITDAIEVHDKRKGGKTQSSLATLPNWRPG
jgi:site-specific DNA recombinase